MNFVDSPQLTFFSEQYFLTSPRAQFLSQWMWQQALENYPTHSVGICPIHSHDLHNLSLTPLNTQDGLPQIFDIFLGSEKYFFTITKRPAKSHTWLLLNFDLEQNRPQHRLLDPAKLEHALIIGMAAYRALKKLSIDPKSLLLSSVRSIGFQLERVRDFMERFNLSFAEATTLCAHDSAMIFDHTPGKNDEIDFLSISYLLKNYAVNFGINWGKFLALGSSGVSLEEKTFSLRKLATNFVTIWPTLSETHESFSKRILAGHYHSMGPLDIPLEYLGPAFDLEHFPHKKTEICVVFDMRGENHELLRPIFEKKEWFERFNHRLIPFKTVFLKDATMSEELFQTSEGKPYCKDQILLNFEDISDIEDFAQKTSLYVRAEVFSNLNDDLLSLFLMSRGAFLFMDQAGWWQKGFRFEFGRRWEPDHERADYFITQFFDVLVQHFERETEYHERLGQLQSYLSENYSSQRLATRLKESYIDKLSSFHEHLHCFELSNFHKLQNDSGELLRYWDTLSSIRLNIEGDYLMLETHELPEAFYTQSGNFFDALEIEIDLDLYAPKMNPEWIRSELIVFDEQARIKECHPIQIVEIKGKGTTQTLHFKLEKIQFAQRELLGIRITPSLSHFEFPFEVKLSAWV